MKNVYSTKIRSDKNIRFQILSNRKEIVKPILLLGKFTKLFFFYMAITSLLWSCEFLDYTETQELQKEQMLQEFGRMKNLLTHVYSYLPSDFSSVGGAIRASASDDAVHVYDLSDIQKFNDGSWNPVVVLDNMWGRMYSGIRAANLFISEAPDLTFDDIRYNQGYNEMMQQYAIYPYEARFLRAYYYFELIKRYGSVPLVTTILTQEEANDVSPSSFDNIVNFIVSECDAVYPMLRETYTGFFVQETGRATKGAALALKARTLLYAASPLHNPTNQTIKWVNAAQASKVIIDQFETRYSPLPAYQSAVNVLSSKELIFERREAPGRSFEEANTAIGFQGGNTGTCPTQNLVDAYEMQATGRGIDESGSGYDPDNPYSGRDPRLTRTILYNGSTWKGQTVEIWNGGLNAPPKPNATKTGYYLRKYMIESISLSPVNPSTAIHYWVIFRYGEVLLNYAEAMNEAYGPELPGPAPLNDMSALQAVNIVRARALMPDFPAGMSQSEFRDKLRNERRVELAFEDHRFWDIRRWKIGDTNDTRNIYGVNITRDASGELTYTPKLVETRFWHDRMYFYPIPQTELFINKNLVQNPLW